jgi:hypothetical protein
MRSLDDHSGSCHVPFEKHRFILPRRSLSLEIASSPHHNWHDALLPLGPDVPPDATPSDFLCAVYRDPYQPMPRRMKAAEAALPFVHAKLAVTASLDTGGFASQLEEMMEARGMRAVIDAPRKASDWLAGRAAKW